MKYIFYLKVSVDKTLSKEKVEKGGGEHDNSKIESRNIRLLG